MPDDPPPADPPPAASPPSRPSAAAVRRANQQSTSTGIEIASRVTTIGMEMAAPPLLGWMLDRWLGTSPWLLILCAALGLYLAFTHLMALSKVLNRPKAPPGAKP